MSIPGSSPLIQSERYLRKATNTRLRSATSSAPAGSGAQRENQTNLQSAEQVVKMLKLCNRQRADYLLNVEPNKSGLIPDYSVERLRQVGELLAAEPWRPTDASKTLDSQSNQPDIGEGNSVRSADIPVGLAFSVPDADRNVGAPDERFRGAKRAQG